MPQSNVIKIKRSTGTTAPGSLLYGELAVTVGTGGTSGNLGGRLFIGNDTDNPVVIGGQYYTNLLSATPGTLAASKAIIVDANSRIDGINLKGSGTGSVNIIAAGGTYTNYTLTLPSDGGTNGYVLSTNGSGTLSWVAGSSGSLSGLSDVALSSLVNANILIYNSTSTKWVNVAVSGDASISNSGSLTLATVNSNTGSFGNSTTVPAITVNGKGLITAVSTNSIPTSTAAATSGGATLGLASFNSAHFSSVSGYVSLANTSITVNGTAISLGGSGTVTANTTNTLTIGTGLSGTSFNGSSAVTIAIDSTVATLTGSQALTNKTINNVTITAPASSATLTIANTKTFTVSNTLTFTGTDSSSVAFGSGGTVAYTGSDLTQFSNTTAANFISKITGTTGTAGNLVFSNTPTLTTPNIGAATGTSLTSSSTTLTLAAAAGNNSVIITPTGTGTVDVSNKRITNVATPVSSTDAVTKEYADAIASSLNVHGAVDTATTSSVSYTYTTGGTLLTITNIASNLITFSGSHNLAINSQILANATSNGLTSGTTYYVNNVVNSTQVYISTTPNGSNHTLSDGSGLSISVRADQGVGATLTGTPNTVDSHALTLNDRILVKNHTTSAYNGVYVVTVVGTGSNGTWTRSTDFDNSPTGEVRDGDFFFVSAGTTNANNGFVQTTNGPHIMGTTDITFTQFSGTGTIVDGAGLLKTGNTLDVQVDSTTTYINGSDQVAVKSSATQYQVLTSSGSGSATWSALSLNQSAAITGTLPIGNGGTGLSSTPTNGQLLIGNGTNYTLATITGTTNQTSITNGSGSITIALSNTLVAPGTLQVTGKTTLAASLTSAASLNIPNATSAPTTPVTGDIWFATPDLKWYDGTATRTVATLDSSQTLTNKTLSTSSIWNGNTISVQYGGTGATTFTTNGILYGNGTSSIQVTAAGTDGYFLYSNAGTPQFTNTIDGGTF